MLEDVYKAKVMNCLHDGLSSFNDFPYYIVDHAINEYNIKIENNRSLGEWCTDNGPEINLNRVSHIIKSIYREDNEVFITFQLLDTPHGNIAKSLFGENVDCMCVARMIGCSNNRNVNEMTFITFDIDPLTGNEDRKIKKIKSV